MEDEGMEACSTVHGCGVAYHSSSSSSFSSSFSSVGGSRCTDRVPLWILCTLSCSYDGGRPAVAILKLALCLGSGVLVAEKEVGL
jgi:hypothetical protein